MTITVQSKVVRNNQLMSTPVGEDIVVLNLAQNAYFGLNDIGRRIWGRLDNPCVVDLLIKSMVAEFAGDPAAITVDILAFLTEMENDGLIHVVAD